MTQKYRIRLSSSAWITVAKEILQRQELLSSYQICKSQQIGAPDSIRRAYDYLMKAMIQLIDHAEPAPAPSHPVPCIENMSREEEIRRRRERTRVYGYEQGVPDTSHRVVLLCSPIHQNNRWHLKDCRFAILRPQGAVTLDDFITRYYDSPSSSIIVVNAVSRGLKDQLVDIGFLFCHWLGGETEYWVLNPKTGNTDHVASRDGEAQRTMNVKMRLMKQETESLLEEIQVSKVLPKDKRTAIGTDRVDIRLDHCATRYMFRKKYGDVGVNILSEMLVSKAHHILRNDTVQ